MFGLEDKHILFIKNTLKKTLNNNAKFYIFGSRAKNSCSRYSDVDIAVDSPDFDYNTRLKLQAEFENSTFPYKIDLVNLNEINEDFKNSSKIPIGTGMYKIASIDNDNIFLIIQKLNRAVNHLEIV